jgi:hypothetical protein
VAVSEELLKISGGKLQLLCPDPSLCESVIQII